MARGHFNPDINPRLLKLIEGMKYDKYNVTPISGYRPGDPRQHGRGQAIDIQLSDPGTQAALANYQDPSTFKAYQDYANAVYQQALQNDPELAKQLRWGGYFSGGKGKYGALDLMHFDTAGDIGMAGGSWAGGLSQDQAKLWGLQAGGGVGGEQQGPGAPSSNPQQAFIETMWPLAVAAGQKTGVDPRLIIAQAAQETGYGKHVPEMNYFGIKGSGGAPQQTLEFVGGKMQPQQAHFRGYKSADESFDDYANFLLQNKRYEPYRTAKGLEAQAAALQATGYATDPNYGASVLKIAQGIPEGGYGYTGAPTGGSTPATTDTVATKPDTTVADAGKKSSWWKDMLGGVTDGKGSGNVATPPVPDLPAPPRAALAAAQPVSSIDPNQGDMQRQKLAMAMARLNSGKLWV